MKRILLAEDDEILTMLIVDSLEDEDYQIDEACDGQEALILLEKAAYDLLIVDYMMPVYSGVEVIGKVRQGGLNQDVAILMLSAKSQLTEQQKAIEAGANYFFAKPFSPLELVKKVREILDGKN